MNANQRTSGNLFPTCLTRLTPTLWRLARTVPVRDPLTGAVVFATAFSGYAQEVVAKLDTYGILDACHLLAPGQSLDAFPRDEPPTWHLVRDGDRVFLFPILTGNNERPAGQGPQGLASVPSP